MTLQDQIDALLDAVAFDSTGTKIGAVRQVYVDNSTGKATFASVATGLFSADAILPLHGARLLDGEVHVDHTKQVVRDSPRQDHTEDALTPDQEAELLDHYGLDSPARPAAAPAEPKTAPAQKAPDQAVPEKTTPETKTPEKAAPEKTTSEKTASEKKAPEPKAAPGTTSQSPTEA